MSAQVHLQSVGESLSLEVKRRDAVAQGEQPRPRVLFVVTSLEVGGIEQYLLRFLRFASARLDATVLCKSGKGGELESEYLRTGVRIIHERLPHIPHPQYLRLLSVMRREGFECVCDFTGGFSTLVLMIARAAGCATRIAFYRESEYQFKKTWLKITYAGALNRSLHFSATKVLSNSRAALDNFHPGWKQMPRRFHVVENGVPLPKPLSFAEARDVRDELGVPHDAFVIGHTGRFSAAKNHRQILRVAAALTSRHSNVYFVLCGRSVKDMLGPDVHRMGLADRCILHNSRTDIDRVLQCLDAFYFPSLNEGMPNALIEALTLGLPFVASDIPSIKQMLPPEWHRFLVAPNDSAAATDMLSSFADGAEFPRDQVSRWARSSFDQEQRFSELLDHLAEGVPQ